MKSLSQSEYGELRSLYSQVYASPEVEITEELIDEIVEELFEECVAEGYTIDEAEIVIEDAVIQYLDEAKVTYGSDTESPEQRRERAKAKVGEKRVAARKAAVKGAVERAKTKVAGAKEKIGKSLTSAARTSDPSKSVKARVGRVSDRASDAKKKAKSGIKGFIKRQAEKVVSRMSEEVEALQATGLFSEREIGAIMEAEMSEGYDEPKMHSAVKRVMTTQPAAKGRAASSLHSKYSMRSKGNVAGETDGPGPNAPKRSGRKGRGAETDRGSGNAAKRRMEG